MGHGTCKAVISVPQYNILFRDENGDGQIDLDKEAFFINESKYQEVAAETSLALKEIYVSGFRKNLETGLRICVPYSLSVSTLQNYVDQFSKPQAQILEMLRHKSLENYKRERMQSTHPIYMLHLNSLTWLITAGMDTLTDVMLRNAKFRFYECDRAIQEFKKELDVNPSQEIPDVLRYMEGSGKKDTIDFLKDCASLEIFLKLYN